ncbi:hypothetical protein HK104_008163, partial [Borealophlyctis nickersoniae]
SKLDTTLQTLDSYDHTHTQHRIATLESDILALQTQVKQAETKARQEEFLRTKIGEDCSELVKENVKLRSEVEDARARLRKEQAMRDQKQQHRTDQLKELEHLRTEVERLKDDMAMMRIAAESKERKCVELGQALKNNESALNKAVEARTVMAERIAELEGRVRQQELEIIQLGQDKSLLIDDVAELRNSTDLRTSKISHLLSENRDLKLDIEKLTRQVAARGEFTHLLREVESSGENYLSLMKS